MPFDDFYKESDIVDRRWQAALVFGLVCAIVYCGVLYFWGQNYSVDEQQPKAEAAERRTSRLASVKNLCQSVPRPEQFDSVSEELLEHNDLRTIFLQEFKSKRKSDEVLPFFQVWFASNGWTKRDRSSGERWATTSAVVTTFYKGNQEISIVSSDWTGFHGIECLENEVKKP